MRPKSSKEIERDIIARMRERYEEGLACESVSSYFEEQGDVGEIPLLVGSERRKIRVISETNVAGEARRGGDICFGNSIEFDASPITNRGVSFHEKTVNFRENTENCPHIMGGYDGGVEVGFLGKWHGTKFRDLLQKLDVAKQAAQQTGNPDRLISFENNVYEVQPKSVSGEVNYRYVVEGVGVKFYIHSNPSGDIQPIRVRYGAEGLIGRDFFFKHNEIRDFLSSIGFSITGEKLSRVDMQVMLNREVTEFIQAIQGDCYVCPAQTYSIYGKGRFIDTITLGKQLQVCIYDKRKELFSAVQSEPYKFALMVRFCFGTEWLQKEIPVTRIEFRLKREILKAMKIDTVDNLLEKESGLSRYCCHSWFRLLVEPKKRGHSNEQKVSKLWQEVQNSFQKYFPGVEGHREEVTRINRTKVLRCSAEQLEKQAIGCLKTAAALRLGSENALSETKKYVMLTVAEQVDKIARGALDRALQYEIRNGQVTSIEQSCKLPDREAVTKCCD